MNAVIQKWGNGKGIRFQKDLLDELGWNLKDVLSVERDGEKVILKKETPKPTWDSLFDGIPNPGAQKFSDFDDAVGGELEW
ncbi:MAG: AbrB/MazE/SpoVT family DNA-binding domain-containing protein [Lachnospiraceae bacterium]|nr:AbrB/MazE/SpoVT family DNA-binding domain-containing protein [Lachnospiraceae bacterium]